jgi:pantoate--beta-alanine ligase
MNVVDSIERLRAARRELPGTVGLVPTMGALHDGHISLVKTARAENNSVVATVFVNPTQFAANEDLSKYPRNLARDLDLFEQAGVDLVFTPTPDLMYPPGFQTWVEVEKVSHGLEGGHRPGHFKGVATVVAKLFNLTQPDVGYFGQKDAQQVAVIKRMARDLNFPLAIVVCPTLREADGLAMSSRNVYLSPEQRAAAGVLYRALQAAADVYSAGETAPETLRQTMRAVLRGESLAIVDYVSAADAGTLQELQQPTIEPILLSLAVRIGTTRLIDNILLPLEINQRQQLTAVLGG